MWWAGLHPTDHDPAAVSFSRRDLPAARAFLDSVYSSGGIRRGRGAKAPADLSPRQVLRYANSLQRQAAAGSPLSLQAARRGPAMVAREQAAREAASAKGRSYRSALEHPKSSWVGPTTRVAGREVPDEEGSAGFHQKTYRSPRFAKRLAGDLTTERIQVIGYGPLAEGYSGALGKGWRVLYTGDREAALDRWDDIMAGWHHNEDGEPDVQALDRVERVQLRWGPAIGD